MKGTRSCVSCLRTNSLTLATIVGVVTGFVIGVCLRTRAEPWTDREAMYVAFIGKLFLQMLKCIIIPLIIPSLISAVGSLDLSLSGKVGGRAIVYYMVTTLLAVFLGIALVTTIQPGSGKGEYLDDEDGDSSAGRNVTTADTLMDLVRNMFPPNIVQAALQQYRTTLVYPGNVTAMKLEGTVDQNYSMDENDKTTWGFTSEWTSSTNILGLVVFRLDLQEFSLLSIVTGIAIAASGEEGRPLLDFFTSVSVVMMRITTWIIYLAPVGVCFLIAGQIIQMKDVGETFKKLGFYFATVVIGLFIHGGLTLPIIMSIATRSLPFRFIGNMGGALLTAFGTASSAATLPVTLDSLERKNGVDPRVSRFVLPIGATINMDGTALYEAIAAIFIAQVREIPLDFGSVVAVSITATAASIGAAGIPQAGLVTMIMVLDTVGLPAEDVALILAVDWLLDRFRTAINVLGDAIGAGIVYHLSKDELDSLNAEVNENGNVAPTAENGNAKTNGNANAGYTHETSM